MNKTIKVTYINAGPEYYDENGDKHCGKNAYGVMIDGVGYGFFELPDFNYLLWYTEGYLCGKYNKRYYANEDTIKKLDEWLEKPYDVDNTEITVEFEYEGGKDE